MIDKQQVENFLCRAESELQMAAENEKPLSNSGKQAALAAAGLVLENLIDAPDGAELDGTLIKRVMFVCQEAADL